MKMTADEYTDSILNIYTLMKQLKECGFISDFKLTNDSDKMRVDIDIIPKRFFAENLTINLNVKKDEKESD